MFNRPVGQYFAPAFFVSVIGSLTYVSGCDKRSEDQITEDTPITDKERGSMREEIRKESDKFLRSVESVFKASAPRNEKEFALSVGPHKCEAPFEKRRDVAACKEAVGIYEEIVRERFGVPYTISCHQTATLEGSKSVHSVTCKITHPGTQR